MGVALPSLAILAEPQNLETRLLPGPFFSFLCSFLLPLFFLSSFFALPFFPLISVHEAVEQGADHGMVAGLEDKAARAEKSSMAQEHSSEAWHRKHMRNT